MVYWGPTSPNSYFLRVRAGVILYVTDNKIVMGSNKPERAYASLTPRLFAQIDERQSIGTVVSGQFAVPLLNGVLLHQQGVQGSGHYAVVISLTVTLDFLGLGLTFGFGDGNLCFGLGLLYFILGLEGVLNSFVFGIDGCSQGCRSILVVNSRTMNPSRFMDSSRRARTSFSNLARLAMSSSEV